MEEGRSIQERVSEEIFELIIGWIKQKKKCLGEKIQERRAYTKVRKQQKQPCAGSNKQFNFFRILSGTLSQMGLKISSFPSAEDLYQLLSAFIY